MAAIGVTTYTVNLNASNHCLAACPLDMGALSSKTETLGAKQTAPFHFGLASQIIDLVYIESLGTQVKTVLYSTIFSLFLTDVDKGIKMLGQIKFEEFLKSNAN